MSDDIKADDNNKGAKGSGPAPKADYDVGYRRPPKDKCFKKGASPNPLGRPKKRERAWSENQLNTDILTEANKMVSVKVNGRTTRITMQELITQRIFMDAARGAKGAMRLSMELVRDAVMGRAKIHAKFYNDLDYLEEFSFCRTDKNPNGDTSFLDYWRKKSRKP